jgi:hypothetical protein
MTQRRPPVPVIGGPLDGQTIAPGTKWPLYLDDQGVKLPSFKGDRVFRGVDHHGMPKTCYIKRVAFPSGDITYVHSTHD